MSVAPGSRYSRQIDAVIPPPWTLALATSASVSAFRAAVMPPCTVFRRCLPWASRQVISKTSPRRQMPGSTRSRVIVVLLADGRHVDERGEVPGLRRGEPEPGGAGAARDVEDDGWIRPRRVDRDAWTSALVGPYGADERRLDSVGVAHGDHPFVARPPGDAESRGGRLV